MFAFNDWPEHRFLCTLTLRKVLFTKYIFTFTNIILFNLSKGTWSLCILHVICNPTPSMNRNLWNNKFDYLISNHWYIMVNCCNTDPWWSLMNTISYLLSLNTFIRTACFLPVCQFSIDFQLIYSKCPVIPSLTIAYNIYNIFSITNVSVRFTVFSLRI